MTAVFALLASVKEIDESGNHQRADQKAGVTKALNELVGTKPDADHRNRIKHGRDGEKIVQEEIAHGHS